MSMSHEPRTMTHEASTINNQVLTGNELISNLGPSAIRILGYWILGYVLSYEAMKP